MKRNSKILLVALCVLVHFTALGQRKSLFNGKDLTGWTIHGTEKWYVENGELV